MKCQKVAYFSQVLLRRGFLNPDKEQGFLKFTILNKHFVFIWNLEKRFYTDPLKSEVGISTKIDIKLYNPDKTDKLCSFFTIYWAKRISKSFWNSPLLQLKNFLMILHDTLMILHDNLSLEILYDEHRRFEIINYNKNKFNISNMFLKSAIIFGPNGMKYIRNNISFVIIKNNQLALLQERNEIQSLPMEQRHKHIEIWSQMKNVRRW